MVLTSDGHIVIMIRSKVRKYLRRSMVVMEIVSEDVISLKCPLWVFPDTGRLMICSFIPGNNSRTDIKRELLSHFTDRLTERHIHNPDISFVLFPSRMANLRASGKCLQM